ncbi:LysR family transcriptional regulator [Agarivorans sp. Toyoura001]|uniref:LysR family transcriptional regulator n=1 Tax=Agarivorans sp. Toyoura001 TaxID=2283141 RepID=UPI0010CF399D|nr:LysR family transcriptional regulator [Agarivorans sp. Toyoura001]GDY25068.1 LysR family transcriptional regulator [Agarivorans sp. Toyoura001]
MNSDNWQWWQYFLAIAEQGSLSRAADKLAVSQPTLSRQLQAMEAQLGQPLFDRSTQGLSLTDFGQGLLEECQHMQSSAQKLQRLATGQAQTLSGRVRLSANELMALHYLPGLLSRFMQRYPQISLEVEVSNHASNLDKRDADVAIRMFPPTQLDVYCRRLFDIPLGFYASLEYLAQQGEPCDSQSLFQHRILGYDRDPQFEEGARQLGMSVKNEQFLLRTDCLPLQLELAKQHAGIVVSHQTLCEAAGLIKLDVGIELPALPLYLVCHRDVQHNKKIRVLMDFLAETLELK